MMGRYLDALRNFRTPHHANQKNLINPAQEGYLGLLGSPPPPIENSIGIKSRWWLVHFRDRAPVEICCNPIAAADTVLRDIAGAVSAEAIADGSSELDSPDQYGHWSDIEVRLAKQRAALFVLRGVALADADALACSLVERDRAGDDRRSCAECVSRSYGRCRHGLEVVGGGGVEVLHRCERFSQIKDG
jgi:hypothetical protein